MASNSKTLALILALGGGPVDAAPQGFAFTYQGELRNESQPVNGQCDVVFSLHDAVLGGNELGAIQPVDGVLFANGLFTVELDFGDVFDGDELYLQVHIGAGCGDPAAIAETLPRTLLTSTPYANYAMTSALADTVDWSNIANRPPGLDDGDDDTLPTLYSAGPGLTLSGNNFELSPTYRLPQGCLDGEIPVWTNGAWICGIDEDRTDFWALGGNAGTTPGADFIGTLDNQALEFRVNGQRAFRIVPSSGAPNLIGGHDTNSVAAGIGGATIAGGEGNRGEGYSSAVAGGFANTAGGETSSIGGGIFNEATAIQSTVGGGGYNYATGGRATIGGGGENTASGFGATIAGGVAGGAAGDYSVVAGGQANNSFAYGATISGGRFNISSGESATVVGGELNMATGEYSIAGGRGAHARLRGQRAFASTVFVPTGSAQSTAYTLSVITSDGSPTALFLDGGSLRLTLPEGMTMTFDLQVVAMVSGGSDYYGFAVRGVAQNDSGTINLSTETPFESGTGAGTWTTSVVANSVHDSLDIVVTGAANTTIRWVATVRATEVMLP